MLHDTAKPVDREALSAEIKRLETDAAELRGCARRALSIETKTALYKEVDVLSARATKLRQKLNRNA